MDEYTPEDETESFPQMSLFQHLYQPPAARAPPHAALRAAVADEPGPRFKDQARSILVEPDIPDAIEEEEEEVQEEAEEEAEIPIANAFLVTDSQIELEDRVRFEPGRQQWEHQSEQQRDKLERQLAAATLQHQKPVAANEQQHTAANDQPRRKRKPTATTTKKQWIIIGTGTTMIVVVAIVLTAGICVSGNCRGFDTDRTAPAVPSVAATPIAAVPTTQPTFAPRTMSEITSITAFINNITLSNRTLRYPSNASAEERALSWLIDDDLGTTEYDTVGLLQRYALSTLWFQTTTGFRSAAGWTLDIPECDWDGVDCDSTSRRVTSLDLFRHGVKGPIPDDLGLLSALSFLDLSSNSLTGTIPSSIASLTALNYLNLRGNVFGYGLAGTIPSSIGSLTALSSLYLYLNSLNGTIPTSIDALTDLTKLSLYGNALTGTMPFCRSNQIFDTLIADCDNVNCPCCTKCCPTSRDGIPAYDDC